MSVAVAEDVFPDTAPSRRRARRRAAVVVTLGVPAGTALFGLIAMQVGAPLWLGVPLGGWLAVLIVGEAVRGAPGLPILTYHSVSEDAAWLPWAAETSIRPDSLAAHLRLIRRMGLRILDTAEVLRARRDGLAVPRDGVCLHFDDGYLDNWVAAWPILQRHNARATVFVSTDFIAPDQPLRATLNTGRDLRWDGFMTWRELRMLEASGTFRVEAHGTDHGRVPAGRAVVGHLTPSNIRQQAWMQWAEMPGTKHDWYLRDPVVPLGTPIPESAPALSHPSWRKGRPESDKAHEARVRAVLRHSRKVLERELGRAPELFCWPQNRATDRIRALAAEAGYIGTTGGRGRNTDTEPPEILARVHAGQDYAGFSSRAFDALALRAHLRCFQGHLVWAPVLTAIGALRRVVRFAQRMSPSHAAGVPPLAEERA